MLQFAKQFRRSKKTPIPAQAQPGPELMPGLALFYQAFWDLTTERKYRDGLIPWSARALWAKEHGLDAEATESLHHHIGAMDVAFLNWKSENAAKRGRGKDKEPAADGDSKRIRGSYAPQGGKGRDQRPEG